MLSANLIDRHFRAGRIDAVIDALSDNGLELPVALRVRLSQSEAAALALGLRRVVELTYGPTPLSRALAQALLRHQAADGGFDGDPIATAAAAAALAALLAEHRQVEGTAEGEAYAAAHARAVAALAGMQGGDGLFTCAADRTLQDRALSSAFILTLLGRDELFLGSVRSAELQGWLEQRQGRLEPDTERMWRLARATAPQPARCSAAVAAIAA